MVTNPYQTENRNATEDKLRDSILDDRDKLRDPILDDRFEFAPEECSIENGKWVFNRSIKPLYSDRSCPYLDRQVSCVKNGRPDSGYRYWQWQIQDCTLPRLVTYNACQNTSMRFIMQARMLIYLLGAVICTPKKIILHLPKLQKQRKDECKMTISEY